MCTFLCFRFVSYWPLSCEWFYGCFAVLCFHKEESYINLLPCSIGGSKSQVSYKPPLLLAHGPSSRAFKVHTGKRVFLSVFYSDCTLNVFRSVECTLETIMWNLKTIFSSERCFRLDATVQIEVTMGDITESRPVNVSFSFFYINSLPISNWDMSFPPSSCYLNT